MHMDVQRDAAFRPGARAVDLATEQGLFLWEDAPGFEDELIVGFAPGANIGLNLDNPAQSGLVIIGADKWPIANLPVDLSGW
jgi:hypothetical protein